MESEKQPIRSLTQYGDSVVNYEQNSGEIFTGKHLA